MTKDLNLLGLRVKDQVTGYEGIVTTIGYDLYGCIQAIVTPSVKEPGKLEDSRWFDTKRLSILHNTPVMEVPRFEASSAIPGPEFKPNYPNDPLKK